MEANAGSVDRPKPPATTEPGKLVIKSVITHERLLKMIEERNPIIAHREQ